MSRAVIDPDWPTIVSDPATIPQLTEAVVIWKPGVTDEANAYHYATRAISFRLYSYSPRLKSVGSMSNQLAEGLGRVTIRLHNADLLERDNVVSPSPDTYTGSRLLVYKILTDGATEGYIVTFDGIVTSMRYTDEFVDLDAVTVVNRAPVISNRRVGQKCAWVFKGTQCGYSGGLTTCNKLFNDSGGCSGRSNQHRFGGFPERSTITAVGQSPSLGPAAAYQLVQTGTQITDQRIITKYNDGFEVIDDSANNTTIVNNITPDWVNAKGAVYKASGSIAPTTGTITSGQSTLTVADASTWQVGHGIRIAGAGTTPGTTTLNGGITSSAGTITVASTSNFPAYGALKIGNEIIYFSAKTATQFTGCLRGYDGTTAASHLNGATVTPRNDLLTMVTAINGTTFTLANSASTSVTSQLVTHDDSQAIADAISDALNQGRPVYIPSGQYYVSPLTIDSANSLIIRGDGPGRTVLYSRHPETILTVDTSLATSHSIIIKDLSFYGSFAGLNNYGLRLRDTGNNGIYNVTLRDLRFEECGNSAIKTETGTHGSFTMLIEAVDVASPADCAGDSIDVFGSNDTTFVRCYVHSVGDGKSAYRVRSGAPVLIGCNGIDYGTNATWATFGNVTAEDGADNYVRATLMGCNVELFDDIGIRCKSGSSCNFFSTTILPSISASTKAIKFDYVTEDQAGIFDSNSTIATSGYTFDNGQPIHSHNVPFVQIGHREFTQYYDTNLATAVSFPAIRPTRIGSSSLFASTLEGYSRIAGYMVFDEQTSPGAATANTGYLYAKDYSGQTGLYWKADGVSEVRIDTGGGGAGSVTSVGLSMPSIFTVSGSPVTSTGTLTATLNNQSANTLLAGPSSGTATTPAFRSLVDDDIPNILTVSKISNLTSNGFVKTSGSDGTLSVDTNSYLTANQTITLSGDITGSGSTSITTAIAAGVIVNADINASAAIAVSKLAASTISGVTLGNNLNALTIGTGLSGTSYNGSSAVTVAIDSTVVTLSGSQTLTNKTLSGAVLTGTLTAGGGVGTNGQVLQSTGTGVQWGTASAGVTDGDKGDITVSGTGATWTIDNDAVTYAKIQNVTDNRLLGRSAGTSGDVQEITVGSGLSLAAGSLTATGGGRDVLTSNRTYYIGFDLGSVTANATTDKIEKTSHGLENGDPVVFSAATAPSGITLGAVYYVVNKSTNDFEISTTVGGSKVTWATNGTTVTCRTGNDDNIGYGTNGRTVALLTVQKFFDKVSGLDKAGYNVTGTLCAGLFVVAQTINVQTGVGSGRCILTGASNTTSIIQGRAQDSVILSDSQVGFQTGAFKLERNNVVTTGSGVCNLELHGLSAGDRIIFYGTTAPTGITFVNPVTGQPISYYVIATDLTANSFKFATTVGGSAVAVGSGTVQVRRSTAFDVLLEIRNGSTLFLTDINFGARPTNVYGTHLWIQSAQVRPIGNWTISGGGAGDFLLVVGNGTYSGFSLPSNITVTITGSPAFTSGVFLRAQRCGVVEMELRQSQNRHIFSGSISAGGSGAAALNGVISTFFSGTGLPGTGGITETTGGRTN